MTRRTITKKVAKVVLLSLTYQLVYPCAGLALTSGPSQPEVQSFEPVGTTDMVDLFSGDFVYNIPLLDVDGYPVNISYHSGVNIEQEASWVGLGWNINPGVVNRSVRGIPDDFSGEKIERELHVKDEKNIKVATGGNVEILGSGFNISAGIFVNSSNYRGMSAGYNTGMGISAFGFASVGVNMGISSQGGADIDYNASLSYTTSQTLSRDFSVGIGINGSGGYNSRNGLKDFSLNVSANYKTQFNNKKVSGGAGLFSTTIPISLQNFTPVITNKTNMHGFGASIGAGGEVYGNYIHGYMGLTMSKLVYDGDGTRGAFGYMNLQNATEYDIVDFTRDKDGMFNKTMQNLPPANTTYDVYSVSAQGTGGIFRPFRNDHGFIYDPKLESSNVNQTFGGEVGFGNLVEGGGNYQKFKTDMESGPWYEARRKFLHKKINGSAFENVYFKQAGELTEVPAGYFNSIQGTNPIDLTPSNLGTMPMAKTGNRDARGNLFYTLTNKECALRDDAANQFSYSSVKLYSYLDTVVGLQNGPNVVRDSFSRVDTAMRKAHHIGEIINVTKDGSRYVYGLPALNNIQKEVTFSVEGQVHDTDRQRGLTPFAANDDGTGNDKGVDNYYSRTVTPTYAHSYLLTNILSTDYVDISNNGPTDDDLGTYVRFNYTRKANDYRWRVPYETNKANYSPGFYCDKKDDKANYILGSKELWYLHTIETKNMVAEFYVSPRQDAKGVSTQILPNGSLYKNAPYNNEAFNSVFSATLHSYKLDSIKLYNKHDRFLNKQTAVPIKSVYFEYDYSLCPGTPNSDAANKGKLTLRKIFMSYGNSDKNLLSPYKFEYYQPATTVNYDIALKDRWGNYKPNNPVTPNFEFPYVDQNSSANNDEYAKMWHMTQISMPSGGVMDITYESDDYAFVQDRRAMEMFKVDGVGTSPVFTPNKYTLYMDKNSPYNYIYFTRRPSEEFSSNIKEVYFNKQNTLYYNFAIDIANKGAYEAVRGYAEIEDAGACPDGTHGWVRVKPKTPQGSGAQVNPMVYTGLNMARYYLPHLFYPGGDPDVSDLENVLRGLAGAAKELLTIGQNPIERFLKEDKAKEYNADRSFVRLHHPGLKKKGGGSRVKEIRIKDSWDYMTSGNSTEGEYGNVYDYTLEDKVYGTISSGVASYEPIVGGDENPFRQPANYYKTVNGSKFPPNDPVELYQEEPIGESLYPPASVGYSSVRVHSIHKDKARSSQTEDEYQFYTARDFPIRVEETAIKKNDQSSKNFFNSKIELTATQGYSIIMNDMHGKPRTIRNYAIRKGNDGIERKELVTGQTFIYNTSGNRLNSNVSGFNYNNGNVQVGSKNLGQEIDVTIDSRQKIEKTKITNVWGNLNTFIVGVYPLPIPTVFFPTHNQNRAFKSLVCTKVVQQYGILKGVETIKDGAKTFVENLVFDPTTGEALLTKSNNEYKEPEYQMNYPAYWAYNRMGTASSNVLVEDSVWLVRAFDGFYGALYDNREIRTANPGSYQEGDELLIHTLYSQIGNSAVADKYFKGWVIYKNGNNPVVFGSHIPFITLSPGAFGREMKDSVRAYVKIIRSGNRNQLTQSIENTTSLDNPVQGSALSFMPNRVLNTKVTTYSDEKIALLPWHNGAISSHWASPSDTNLFVFGYKGNFRPVSEYVYFADRDYNQGHARKDGTYPITVSFWNKAGGGITENTSANNSTLYQYWKLAKSVTAYNVWGNELENVDALGIPSSASYGFNYTHPVTVSQNAKYYEAISEGFEDYRLLHSSAFIYPGGFSYEFSPFRALFPLSNPSQLSPSTFYKFYTTTAAGVELSTAASHTGNYSLKTTSAKVVTIKTLPLPRLNPFSLDTGKTYVLSYWAKPVSGSSVPVGITVSQHQSSGASIPGTNVVSVAKTNAIDGWIQFEASFTVASNAAQVRLTHPGSVYYDDIRIFPVNANMKSFVYHPLNQKLVASLDENNFATFYEYDPEGQLVRINKETERGILTVQESRRANMKK